MMSRPIREPLLAALAALLAALAGCLADDEQPGSSPVLHVQAVSQTPSRALAARAQSYVANYGSWDAAEVEIARQHDLVILDPNDPGVDRSLVAAIQGGAGDRVIVLCYVSAGEDRRTVGRSDAEMAGDPRFAGNGSGPRVDPRGPEAIGGPLDGLDPRGLPSPGGTGWASWYLDDNSVRNDPAHVGDGIPDRNGIFGGYFTNAGDPAWFEALQNMSVDGPAGIAGLREVLTTSYGRGLGCDGVFLDTFDTAAPNVFTGPSSANQSEFEWTAPGFSAFVHRLRSAYPDAVILQNRALFFFDPRHPHYEFNPGGTLDFVLFESYRLDSDETHGFHPYFHPDNRFNVAPKLMAEANRPPGFRVLSLGYAEAPANQMSELTLLGQSSLGFASLVEDIRVTERLAGFRHYLTDASVELVNDFVARHADRNDLEPPVWTSTYNANQPGFPQPPGPPNPRVGIQEIAAGPGTLTLRWDVALDLHRVGYAAYYQTEPFDFAADPELTSATRVELSPEPTAAYADGVGPFVYANQATLTGLAPGQTHHVVIRAFDHSPAANEDANQVVLSAAPGGEPAYLGGLLAKNGASDLTYRFEHSPGWPLKRVYIDRDRLPGTGAAKAGIGADFMIENDTLYRHDGGSADWSWTPVGRVSMTTESVDGHSVVRWDLEPDDIDGGVQHTQVIFELERPGERRTSDVYQHVYTTADPDSPISGQYAFNNAEKVYYRADIDPSFTWKHAFIDTDAERGTGYPVGGIGAEYLIENGSLYRHVGPLWNWRREGEARLSVDGSRHDWWLWRADLGAAGGAPLHRVVFHASGGGEPDALTPIYEHRFSP